MRTQTKCVSNYPGFTIGVLYPVTDSTDMSIQTINDSGRAVWVYKRYFNNGKLH